MRKYNSVMFVVATILGAFNIFLFAEILSTLNSGVEAIGGIILLPVAIICLVALFILITSMVIVAINGFKKLKLNGQKAIAMDYISLIVPIACFVVSIVLLFIIVV